MLFTGLRLFFTLRHTTSRDALAALAGQDTRLSTMSPAALARWLDRCQGFGESPIKRPVEMRLDLFSARRGSGPARMVRCHRRFTGQPTEITRVMRCDDLLFQENEVGGWQTNGEEGEPWTMEDLEGATLRVRAAFLSFDDVNFRRPPRLWNLHLHLGGALPAVLFFTPEELEAPRISEDPTPLLRSSFFRTLLLDYHLPLTAGLLARQLRPLRQLHA